MTATEADPREIIDKGEMSSFQWRVVAIMIGLNALDGFDVLSISFAAPGISSEWGIDRVGLGFVLSMELVGMAIGSIVLGRIADRSGRRNTILGCLAAMTIGMFGAATAKNVEMLAAWRVFTGLGIGGMLAATNAAVAEVSSVARRPWAVILMAAGYPVGTVVGGTIASLLLARFDWRAVFIFGGAISLLFVPIVLRWAPESIAFLMHRRRAGALSRINGILMRMGHPPVAELPDDYRTSRTGSTISGLFSRTFLRPTLLMTLAYFAHITTFYFILKWIPKIVSDMGFDAARAGSVLVWASLGGLTGAILLGALTRRAPVRSLTIIAMLLSVAFVILFGNGARDLGALSLFAAIAGFATNAGVVGLYALLATNFPTELRASATGFVIGVGRGGAALAPAIAGMLFAAGQGLAMVAGVMAMGSGIALIALLFLRRPRLPDDGTAHTA